MTLEEITQKDFEKMQTHSYFRNGVLFDLESDNVLAFMEDVNFENCESPFRYFKVIRGKNEPKNS